MLHVPAAGATVTDIKRRMAIKSEGNTSWRGIDEEGSLGNEIDDDDKGPSENYNILCVPRIWTLDSRIASR